MWGETSGLVPKNILSAVPTTHRLVAYKLCRVPSGEMLATLTSLVYKMPTRGQERLSQLLTREVGCAPARGTCEPQPMEERKVPQPQGGCPVYPGSAVAIVIAVHSLI